MPMDPRIGKALIFATMLGCIEPVLTIVSLLSHRNPFVMPLNKKNLADQAKRRFADGIQSDHFAILNAYAIPLP